MTTELPLISVITPSLNQGMYIEDNIRSVLNQHYPNFEHIVIDGGSTDGSVDILAKYNHLIWVSEEDTGQSEAINKGLKSANGEIIGWLNSDDCYEPHAFSTIVQELNEGEGRYIVFGDCNVINEGGKRIGYCKGRLTDPEKFIKYWEKNYTIPQPAVFFRRDILQTVGFLDEDLHYVMDYDFWLRVSKHYRIHYIRKPLAKMRVHNRAKSSLTYELFEREWFKVLKKCRGDLFWLDYYRYLLMAFNFRSNLMRMNAYSEMGALSLKDFRKKIIFSIVYNPFNIFRRKFASALLRAILGHQHLNRIKYLLQKP